MSEFTAPSRAQRIAAIPMETLFAAVGFFIPQQWLIRPGKEWRCRLATWVHGHRWFYGERRAGRI